MQKLSEEFFKKKEILLKGNEREHEINKARLQRGDGDIELDL